MSDRTASDLDRAFAAVVDEAHGEVSLDGDPHVLIDREALAEIQREMEAILGRGAEGILVRAGHARGSRLATRLSTLVGGREDTFLEGLRVFAARTGLCRFEAFLLGDRRVDVRARNSFMGVAYGGSRGPVCHYLRGFVLAVAEHLVHEKGLECRERACAAAGGDACEFEVVPVPGSTAPWGGRARTGGG